MKFELVARPFTYKSKDGKERTGYNFFLKRDDGYEIRIRKYYNQYEGKTYDNERELVALSTIEKE